MEAARKFCDIDEAGKNLMQMAVRHRPQGTRPPERPFLSPGVEAGADDCRFGRGDADRGAASGRGLAVSAAGVGVERAALRVTCYNWGRGCGDFVYFRERFGNSHAANSIPSEG